MSSKNTVLSKMWLKTLLVISKMTAIRQTEYSIPGRIYLQESWRTKAWIWGNTLSRCWKRNTFDTTIRVAIKLQNNCDWQTFVRFFVCQESQDRRENSSLMYYPHNQRGNISTKAHAKLKNEESFLNSRNNYS